MPDDPGFVAAAQTKYNRRLLLANKCWPPACRPVTSRPVDERWSHWASIRKVTETRNEAILSGNGVFKEFYCVKKEAF